MEEELNYLSEKIEELERECFYYENESRCNESERERAEINEIWTRKSTELQHLNNIINFITEQYC